MHSHDDEFCFVRSFQFNSRRFVNKKIPLADDSSKIATDDCRTTAETRTPVQCTRDATKSFIILSDIHRCWLHVIHIALYEAANVI